MGWEWYNGAYRVFQVLGDQALWGRLLGMSYRMMTSVSGKVDIFEHRSARGGVGNMKTLVKVETIDGTIVETFVSKVSSCFVCFDFLNFFKTSSAKNDTFLSKQNNVLFMCSRFLRVGREDLQTQSPRYIRHRRGDSKECMPAPRRST